MLPTPKRARTISYSKAPKSKAVGTQTKRSTATAGSVLLKKIPRGIPIGCPKEMRVRLRYHTSAVLAAPAGGIASYVSLRANGPFDPAASIGGDQPRYYDEWTNIYNSVTVVGSYCQVHFANEQYDNSIRNCMVGVMHSANSTPISGTATLTKVDAIEATHSKYALASGNNAVHPKIKWTPDQYFIGKTLYDEDLASGVGTTPNRECWFHVWTSPDITSGTAYPNRTYNIDIEYDCIFFDPVIPLQST